MSKFVFTFGYSVWIIVALVLVSLIMTYLYYRKTNPELDTSSKLLLGSLRFLALLFLFFFFVEPVANYITNKFKEPKVAVIIDNSSSMKLKWQNTNKYRETIDFLNNSGLLNFKKYSTLFFKFSSATQLIDKFHPDSLRFEGDATNLNSPFKRLSEIKSAENIQAVVLISDGIQNAGENPIPTIERLALPVFTVGIGDTNAPKDLIVSSITTNDVAFVDKATPVKVSIKSFGYENKQVNVELFDGQNLVAQQPILLSKENEDYSVVFQFTPKNEGFAKLIAKVQPIQDEFSTENNQQSVLVKVIKSKKKYIILSGYPNPDIAYLKSLILQESGSEISVFIQKQGAEFYEPAPKREDFENAQIIILLGFPISTSNNQLLFWTRQEFEKGKSVLFIPQLNVDYRKLKPFEDILPFTIVGNTAREYTFVANFDARQSGNPLLNIIPGVDNLRLLNQLPPIFRTELFVRPKPESEVLATIKINDAEMKEPFAIVSNFQNRKTSALLGYGLYRWRLLGNSLRELLGTKGEDIGSEFLMKLFQWLSITDEQAKVRIKPAKTKFYTNEKVSFLGQIYDESLNPVDNAKVVVKINKGKEIYETVLSQIASGLYSREIGYFAEGDYTYTGEAYISNRLLGKVIGRFTVEKSNLELTDFRSRFDFLRYISKTTAGNFYFSHETQKFINDLNSLKLEDRIVTSKKEIAVWNLFPLLVISVIIFSIEWYLRRKKGLL